MVWCQAKCNSACITAAVVGTVLPCLFLVALLSWCFMRRRRLRADSGAVEVIAMQPQFAVPVGVSYVDPHTGQAVMGYEKPQQMVGDVTIPTNAPEPQNTKY